MTLRRIAPLLFLFVLLTGCQDVRPPADKAVGWFRPYGQIQMARCIAWLESNNNPRVVGSAGEIGIFQIHPIHKRDYERYTGKPWSTVYDPNMNGYYALHLWRDGDNYQAPRGWRQWSTSRYCHN